MAHFDVVVLGCGPAGERAAIQAARAGKQVAVVERAHVVGGNRVNWGTIPSKTLRESAVFFYQLTRNRLHGIRYEVGPRPDRGRLHVPRAAVVQRELELINESLGPLRASSVVQGHGRFAGPHAVAVKPPGRRRHVPLDRRLLRDRHRLAPQPPRRRARSTARPSSTPRRSCSLPRMPKTMTVLGRGCRRHRVREHLRRPRDRGDAGRHPRPPAAVLRPRDRGRRSRASSAEAGGRDPPRRPLHPDHAPATGRPGRVCCETQAGSVLESDVLALLRRDATATRTTSVSAPSESSPANYGLLEVNDN